MRSPLHRQVDDRSGSRVSPSLNLLHQIPQNFYLISVAWSLVLLTPHVPGIPRPAVGGLSWRQELGFSILLAATLAIFVKRNKFEEILTDRRTLAMLLTLGAFAFWILLSSSWAVAPYAAIHLGTQWVLYAAFFAVVTHAAKDSSLVRSALIVLGGIVSILAIACAIESLLGAPLTDGNLRNDLKPILRGSAGFGEIMAMASILFAGFSLYVKQTKHAVSAGSVAVLCWLATIQSMERAPFIGAVVGYGLLFAGAIFSRSLNKRSFLRLALLIACLTIGLGLQTFASSTATAPAGSSTVARLAQNPAQDNNTRVRFLFWGVALEMFRLHPLIGVGGNNYDAMFGMARAEFADKHPNSSLITMNEDLLTVYAHNEYLQILAELGVVGFLFVALFAVQLLIAFRRSVRNKPLMLPAWGAAGAMLAFAISSGASASSFRYFGAGLMFFFCAALLVRIAHGKNDDETQPVTVVQLGHRFCRRAFSGLFACVLLACFMFTAQAAGTMLHGMAQVAPDAARTEDYYRGSLKVFPTNPAAHFSYGLWLGNQHRPAEAVSHLEYATTRGFNSSVCYVYLASAQEAAGDTAASERTLAAAVSAYPSSTFLLARYSSVLERTGQTEKSKSTFAKALLVNPAAALGWQQVIENDIDAAFAAAQKDKHISLPGNLIPQAGLFEILQENERRFPDLVNQGWRARMRSQKP